jgi:hypothetical protein
LVSALYKKSSNIIEKLRDEGALTQKAVEGTLLKKVEDAGPPPEKRRSRRNRRH